MGYEYAFTAFCDFCDAQVDFPKGVHGWGDPLRMKVPDRWSLLTFNHPAIDKKISKLLCDKHPGITFDIIAQEPASPPLNVA